MNVKNDHQPEKIVGLEGRDRGKNYDVLRSTDKQIDGINLASQILGKKLGIDKALIRTAFVQVYTEMQIQDSRFHYEGENDLPQVKLALKKIMEPKLKSKLYTLMNDETKYAIIDLALDSLYQWYMNEYLTSN